MAWSVACSVDWIFDCPGSQGSPPFFLFVEGVLSKALVIDAIGLSCGPWTFIFGGDCVTLFFQEAVMIPPLWAGRNLAVALYATPSYSAPVLRTSDILFEFVYRKALAAVVIDFLLIANSRLLIHIQGILR